MHGEYQPQREKCPDKELQTWGLGLLPANVKAAQDRTYMGSSWDTDSS